MKAFKRKSPSPPPLVHSEKVPLPNLTDVEEVQHGILLLRAIYKLLNGKPSKPIPSRELMPVPTPKPIPPSYPSTPQELALASLKDALRAFILATKELPKAGRGLKPIAEMLLSTLGSIQEQEQETPEIASAFLKLADILRMMHDYLRKIPLRARENTNNNNDDDGMTARSDQMETDLRLVHEIQQRMVMLTSDVHAAVTQGTHASFFDTSNGGSAISSHFSQLEVILGAITEQEGNQNGMQYYRVEESHILQRSVYAESMPATREFRNLVAGPGGSGGKAQEGGSGGEGGGFTITLDSTQSYRFEGLKTGAGGEGGEGTVKGGVGGSAGWFKIG